MSEFSLLLSDQEISNYLSQFDKKQWPQLLKRLVLYSIRSLGALEAAGFSVPSEFAPKKLGQKKDQTPPAKSRKKDTDKIVNISNKRDAGVEAKIQRKQHDTQKLPSYIEKQSQRHKSPAPKDKYIIPTNTEKKPESTFKRPSYAGWIGEYSFKKKNKKNDISLKWEDSPLEVHKNSKEISRVVDPNFSAIDECSSSISSYEPPEDMKRFYQQEYRRFIPEEIPRRLEPVELSLDLNKSLNY